MLCSSFRRLWRRTNPSTALSAHSHLLESLPFPGCSCFCPPFPVFLQREPLQSEAITCCLPLGKETSQRFQACASSCTRPWLPTDQTQGKRALGSKQGKADSVLSPRAVAVCRHPADACVARDCIKWLWLGRRVCRLHLLHESTTVFLCSRVRWGVQIPLWWNILLSPCPCYC